MDELPRFVSSGFMRSPIPDASGLIQVLFSTEPESSAIPSALLHPEKASDPSCPTLRQAPRGERGPTAGLLDWWESPGGFQSWQRAGHSPVPIWIHGRQTKTVLPASGQTSCQG